MKPKRLTRRILRARRAELNLIQIDVARRAHMSLSRYCEIENEHRIPTAHEGAKIARVLRSTVMELFGRDLFGWPEPNRHSEVA